MPKRRAYHKVRGACLTCKERKVRCGLERPTCKNCSRLSRPCAYATPASRQEGAQLPLKCDSCRSRLINEVQLMHHYTAYTYLAMSNNPVLISLWKEVVPKHAFQHRFLLQGLLAVTAQHKLRDKSDDPTDLIDIANIYQQEALSTYISQLNYITEENCHALFAFSQVIVGMSYSRMSSGLGEVRISSFITNIVEIFELLKGALVVAKEGITWLRAGDLEPMLGPRPEVPLVRPSAPQRSCVGELSKLSDYISGLMDSSVESKARVESLLSTIQLLYTLFYDDCEPADRMNKIVGLPIYFDSKYIDLLRNFDHAALAILSYYGIALHQIRHIWYLDAVGARVVEAAATLVGPGWFPFLRWPQMEIGS
ncbi:hypothetical protein D8B26_004172 [Coccidioides posadasii str. Silveira]|uniref:Uncharacterized protein n=1 Tax=Coccidioides posadasii (strain RMSCC 757 / Silveira) TaxID=443226 RepID=E9DJ71_COCPS|nr:conserved hypothetical protein [Coccidioides posadasii str. Silveira]QVM09514.1 hypothetical protein D8B26_004172 [Coccidioides posadasii str. Silveira]